MEELHNVFDDRNIVYYMRGGALLPQPTTQTLPFNNNSQFTPPAPTGKIFILVYTDIEFYIYLSKARSLTD